MPSAAVTRPNSDTSRPKETIGSDRQIVKLLLGGQPEKASQLLGDIAAFQKALFCKEMPLPVSPQTARALCSVDVVFHRRVEMPVDCQMVRLVSMALMSELPSRTGERCKFRWLNRYATLTANGIVCVHWHIETLVNGKVVS